MYDLNKSLTIFISFTSTCPDDGLAGGDCAGLGLGGTAGRALGTGTVAVGLCPPKW